MGKDRLMTVLVLFFITTSFLSLFSYRIVEVRADRLVNRLAEKHHSVVLTMIHRVVTVGLLGIPVREYIREEDAERILARLENIPPEKPVDVILHTPGGDLLPAIQIARALKRHKGPVTVYVPFYAMSGGTLIALAADRIVMGEGASLGPVDPQLIVGGRVVPAVSVLRVLKEKGPEKVSDETLLVADQAKRAVRLVSDTIRFLLAGRVPAKTVDRLVKRLVLDPGPHAEPLFAEDLKKLGLNVSTDMPPEIFELMELFKYRKGGEG